MPALEPTSLHCYASPPSTMGLVSLSAMIIFYRCAICREPLIRRHALFSDHQPYAIHVPQTWGDGPSARDTCRFGQDRKQSRTASNNDLQLLQRFERLHEQQYQMRAARLPPSHYRPFHNAADLLSRLIRIFTCATPNTRAEKTKQHCYFERYPLARA